MSKTYKWILLGGASLLAFCFVFFYHVWLSLFASSFLHVYSISKWGSPLKYDNLSFDGSQLILQHPYLENESSFIADKAILRFHFNPLKRMLNLDVEVVRPSLLLQSSKNTALETWAKAFYKEEKWIKTQSSIRIHKGLLTCLNENAIEPKQISFDLQMDSQRGDLLKLYLNALDSSIDCLTLKTFKTSQGMKINCNCESIQCSSLIAFTKFLGFDISPWKISTGTIQGNFSTLISKNMRPYLEGHLITENLSFDNAKEDFRGIIEKAHLHLEKNPLAYQMDSHYPPTIGKLELYSPASLTFQSGPSEWSIHDILGTIKIDEKEIASIDLKAKSNSLNPESSWHLQGQASLNAQHPFKLDAFLTSSTRNLNEGKIFLAIHQTGKDSKLAKIQGDQLSSVDCNLMQNLLSPIWPEFNQILFKKGTYSGIIETEILHGGLGEIYIKQFEAVNIHAHIKPWNMSCHFSKSIGHGKVNLSKKNLWETLHMGLHLEDGQIEFENITPLLSMNDIQAHLLIHDGLVEHSLITLNAAGLKGKMDIEWGDNKQLLTFKLDGMAQDLVNLFPKKYQDGFQNHFAQNRIIVLANLKKHNKIFEVDGTVHIQRTPHSDLMDLIHFGCELKKSKEGSHIHYFPVGWFHAKNIPLDKFLSPFIFQNNVLLLSGEGEFQGSFNDQILDIKYNARHLKLENDKLSIHIPNFQSLHPGHLSGSHRFNLIHASNEGSFPFTGGTYIEKNTGLCFQDIHGIVYFKDDMISLSPIETYCQGILFSGNIDLDYHNPQPGFFDVSIRCPSFSGTVTQTQNLLAQLHQPSFFNAIPLDGEITGKGRGLNLKFAFEADDYNLEGKIEGLLSGGSLIIEETDMALKEIYFDLDYEHPEKVLKIKDIQGTLLIGKPRHVEEFHFFGDHVNFNLMPDPNIQFDIGVNDRENELLRLVGYSKEEDGIKKLHLDSSLSHFSCIYPQHWQCNLNDWSSLSQFYFRSQFDLQIFLQDLKRFRNTGFLFLSHRIIDRVSQYLPFEGKGILSLHYDPETKMSFQLEGFHIKQENSLEHYALLKGSKQDKKWIIDQLQWDHWNASAELHQMPDKWKISYLTLKAKNTLLMGLEGEWLHEQALLQARLKFCEIDLSQLDFFDPMQSFVTKWWPKGIVKATGEMEWDLLTTHPFEGLRTSLYGTVDHLTLRDYPIQIKSPFSIKFQPFHQFLLENVLVDLSSQNKLSTININHFDYSFANDSMRSLKAHFHIPHFQLKIIGDDLHHHFSDFFDAITKEVFTSSKNEGLLKGSLAIESLPEDKQFLKLELEDGLYSFKGKEFDLKKFHMQVVNKEMEFHGFSHLERCPYQISGYANWPECNRGQLKLLCLNSSQPLMINWEKDVDQDFLIRSIQGEFNGCNVALKMNSDSPMQGEWIPMQGEVNIDFNQFSTLLPLELSERIQKLKVGSHYFFQGSFWINPHQSERFLDSFSFKGKMNSNEAILKGYQLQHLTSDVQYVPDRLDMQNFLIRDPAGTIKTSHCIITRNNLDDSWNFDIPRLIVKNLRPNLLREVEPAPQANPKMQSLMLKRVEFQQLQGNLFDIPSWHGQGTLHFVNPMRKNHLNTLFAIPAEIILRIGLDPHVMNPVTGFIYFDVKGDRFLIKRFRDVYSEGRGSKFILAQGLNQAWMDWDGNLSVDIRMKQYNLIFKLTELFTISVQGNIRKPVYRLHKKTKINRKDAALVH